MRDQGGSAVLYRVQLTELLIRETINKAVHE
jgi:hypothetical protein